MEQLELYDLTKSTSSAEEPRARTFPSPESELAESAEAEPAPHSAGRGSILSAICNLGSSYGRTCRDVSALAIPTEATSPSSQLRLGNSGILSRGALWTFSTPEWTDSRVRFPNVDAAFGCSVCGLSDVLEPMESEEDFRRLRKYFLSARACSGILRRAESRGKKLPDALANALTDQILMWESGEFNNETAHEHNDDESGAGRADD